MRWRNLNVIIVLILANYLVFSTIAAFVFPAPTLGVPTHIPQPTFTLAATLQRVAPLSYSFLTPSPTPTLTATPGTVTPSTTPTTTVGATTTVTATVTVEPTHSP